MSTIEEGETPPGIELDGQAVVTKSGSCETFGCEQPIDEVVQRGDKFIGVCSKCIYAANSYRTLSRKVASLPVIISAMTKQKSHEKITQSLNITPRNTYDSSLSDEDICEVRFHTGARLDLAAEIEALMTSAVLTPDEIGGLGLVVQSLRK